MASRAKPAQTAQTAQPAQTAQTAQPAQPAQTAQTAQTAANHEADAYFTAYLTAIDGRNVAISKFLTVVGDNPTYEEWESFRLGFGAVYRTKRPKATDDAVNTAWARFVADVKAYAAEMNLIQEFPTKPKAASPDAVRKQAARALPDAVAAANTLEELDAIAIPAGPDGAKLQAAALKKKGDLILAAARESEKAAGAALKGLKDQIITAVKACNDRAVLEAAHAVLQAEAEAEAEADELT